MTERRNSSLMTFVNGEWSPLMAGRTDSEEFAKSLSWCQNFIVRPQGPIDYRPGNYLCNLTPLNVPAVLIPWQFSANDAIVIEATNQLFRFYRNNQIILNPNLAITGITNANPAVVTSAAHGYSNGQEVVINNVNGMPQINGRHFIVAGVTTNTFQLTDQYGANVNSTAYGVYSSGGVVASVYTLATPYQQVDLALLRYAQIGDLMYIVHPNYPPYKLTRAGFTSWTLATFTRTNDPFSGVAVTPTAISEASPAVITVASTTGMATGDIVSISNVEGMTNLNGNTYKIVVLNSTTFSLYDPVSGNPINTIGGYPFSYLGNRISNNVRDASNWPSVVQFTSDGRLAYGCSRLNPQGWWVSELPGTLSGSTWTPGTTTNYDVFTTGVNDYNAYAYQFAPVNGIIDAIQEMKQFGGNFALLGASSITQVYGSAPGQPANVTAIGTNIAIAGAAHVQPIVDGWTLIYVDVNQIQLKGLQFNFYYSNYAPVDYSQATTHFGAESPFIKMVHVKGVPSIIWVLRQDGVLLSLTYDNVEKVAAWARHYVGGGGKVLDICTIRNANGEDQLWTVVQRTIGANVTISVEVLSPWPDIPLEDAFYTGNQTNDQANFASAAWEALKLATYLDMSQTYDGTARGTAASADITPSAATGNGITITADQPVFQVSDVGSQIWKRYTSTGAGGGQAYITGFTSSTVVTADVIAPFDNPNQMLAGTWAFAVSSITNLQLFAGQTMNVQADGGAHPPVTITAGGAAVLQWPCSMVQIGYGYTGLAITQNLDFGTRLGPGNSKPRAVKRIRPRVSYSLGGQVGTSKYNCQPLPYRRATQIGNRPPTPYTGSLDMAVLDTHSNNVKHVVALQTDPTPFTLVGFDIEMYTNEPP